MDGQHRIIDRVGFLIAANISALVNGALEGNSLAIFDEHIRQARIAMDALISAEGVQRGSAKTLTRHIDAMQASIAQADREVDLLLARGERGLAGVRQSVLNKRSDTLANLQSQRSQCLEQVARLSAARANLSARIEVLEAERLQLEGLLEQRRVTKRYQSTLLTVGTGLADSGQTSMIIDRAQDKLDQEQGKLEAITTTVESTTAALLETDRVDQQLEMRQARLREADALPALSAPGSSQEAGSDVPPRRKRLASGRKAKSRGQTPEIAQQPPAKQE